MASVNGSKKTRGGVAGRSGRLAGIARVLQSKPSAIGEILSRLHKRGLLATSPARQVAQTAIASRCGDSVEEGISYMEALSVPVEPVKLFGLAADLGSARLLGTPNRILLQGYDDFRSPFPLLKGLPERHSFVDLFELLLLSSHEPAGGKSTPTSQAASPSAAVIAGRTAQVAMRHSGYVEVVKYGMPEEVAGRRKDVAQFTGHTIALLAGLAEEHLVWRPAIAYTLCG
jgi:hypothetical protein